MVVYQDPEVSASIELFGDSLDQKHHLNTVDYLFSLAERLVVGHQQHHPGIGFICARFFQTPSVDTMFDMPFTLDNALWCITQEHSYQDWDDAISRNDKPNAEFENLIDTLLMGDIKKLTHALKAKPEMIHQTSHYPHKATLLHYSGSNGVEGYRQIVPSNLALCIEQLILAGADIEQKTTIYGGSTAQELLVTSKHPYQAGVIEDAKNIYERFANASSAS